MKWQLIDLSVALEPTSSEPEPVSIEEVSHREGATLLTHASGISADSFPDGIAVNLERIKLTSHSGTHVDAPLHYGPFSGGKKSRSIDEMPLEWFYGPGCVIDCNHTHHKKVSKEELQQALLKQQLTLDSGDIVFIFTGADRLWGKSEYFTDFRGMSVEATEWLLHLGIRVIGIDSFGFDQPFQKMISAFKESGDSQELWPCHVLGRKYEYCQIERLSNLSQLPLNRKFLVSCFPIKLKGCGAGPSRVVACVTKE